LLNTTSPPGSERRRRESGTGLRSANYPQESGSFRSKDGDARRATHSIEGWATVARRSARDHRLKRHAIPHRRESSFAYTAVDATRNEVHGELSPRQESRWHEPHSNVLADCIGTARVRRVARTRATPAASSSNVGGDDNDRQASAAQRQVTDILLKTYRDSGVCLRCWIHRRCCIPIEHHVAC
jgi:hypothetical protein